MSTLTEISVGVEEEEEDDEYMEDSRSLSIPFLDERAEELVADPDPEPDPDPEAEEEVEVALENPVVEPVPS